MSNTKFLAVLSLVIGLMGAFTIADALSVFVVPQGGTGKATFSGGFIYSAGGTGALSASSSPTVGWINGTTSTATSTLAGPLATKALNVTGSASSTFANGIILNGGCLYQNGACLSQTSGTVTSIVAGTGLNGGTITTSGTISLISYLATSSPDTKGQLPYYTSTNGTPVLLGAVSTTSIGATAPITFSGTAGAQIGGAAGTYGCTTASISAAGCISTASFNLFNTKVGTGTADTANQVAFFSTTNATPPLISGNSALTFTSAGATLLTATNASTTYFTVGTFATLPTSASCTNFALGSFCVDTTSNQLQVGTSSSAIPIVYNPIFHIGNNQATSSWSGTTTQPFAAFTDGGQIKGILCWTDAGTLDVQISYGPNATKLPMTVASTTGFYVAYSGVGSIGANSTSTISIGTPASSPTQIECTADGYFTKT